MPEHRSHPLSEAHVEHKAHAPHRVTCVVITCSDTRDSHTDTSGQLMMRLLKEQGHEVAGYHVVKDEPSEIRRLIEQAAQTDSVQAILVNGGTGISKRDSTFEAVDGMLEKRLVGFGEIFRYLTYQDIGSPAIMTRATAGIFRGRVVFSTPRLGRRRPPSHGLADFAGTGPYRPAAPKIRPGTEKALQLRSHSTKSSTYPRGYACGCVSLRPRWMTFLSAREKLNSPMARMRGLPLVENDARAMEASLGAPGAWVL